MVVTDMRKAHILLCLLIIIVLPTTLLAKLTARIDRKSMAIDETLTLTLTRDSTSFFSGPDLTPLEKDFTVQGQSQSSKTSIINGSATSSVDWQIVLSPRRTGTLEIPPISIGKEQSNALHVQVQEASQPKTKADSAPIFIETDVDTDSVYVQSQVVVTLRLYWAVEARIAEPADPQIKDALIKRLDDTTFDKTINGDRYKVFERKYVLFPQKSGKLEIPPFIVEVTVPSRQRSRGFFDPFGMTGEKIKLRSEPKTITVQEKPASYPADAVWLPAATMIVKEKWNSSQELSVGDSTTITISLTADGLLGEQLPPITFAEPEGIKLYQGKAEVDNTVSPNGIVGMRQESIAMIPTKPGTFELPEIRIPWWDKQLEKIEYAVIPARTITVKGSAAVQAANPAAAMEKPQQEVPVPVAPRSIPSAPPTFWILLCALLAVGWLITLYLLIQTHRKIASFAPGTTPEKTAHPAAREEKAFQEVARTCRENNPVAARKAVLDWLRVLLPDAKIITFADAEKALPAPELFQHLQELDKILYDPAGESGTWKGSGLLDQARQLRAHRPKNKKGKPPLESLYK